MCSKFKIKESQPCFEVGNGFNTDGQMSEDVDAGVDFGSETTDIAVFDMTMLHASSGNRKANSGNRKANSAMMSSHYPRKQSQRRARMPKESDLTSNLMRLLYSGVVTVVVFVLCLFIAKSSLFLYPQMNWSNGLFASKSLYNCHSKCMSQEQIENDDNIVYVELVAKILPFYIRNKKAGFEEVFWTRTWEDKAANSGNIMGPTIEVKAGNKLVIKVINHINTTISDVIGPRPPTKSDWIPYMDPSNPANNYVAMQAYGLTFTNTPTTDIEEINVINSELIPGNYDDVNLHLHGLNIKPHLFFPIGTSDPNAEYIAISPGQCFCYVFDIPPTQPPGTYWYHPHRHGAVAIQSWSGMAGLLIVKDDEKLESRLKQQGIEKDMPFVIWSPHFERFYDNEMYKKSIQHLQDNGEKPSTTPLGKGSTLLRVKSRLVTGTFLHDQTANCIVKVFVNGEYRPGYNVDEFGKVRLRILAAHSESLTSFQIYYQYDTSAASTDKVLVPFQHIASDGINFNVSKQKTVLVLGGGQREDIVVDFNSNGIYTVVNEGLSKLQFFNTGPSDQILATYTVKDKGGGFMVDDEIYTTTTTTEEEEEEPNNKNSSNSKITQPNPAADSFESVTQEDGGKGGVNGSRQVTEKKIGSSTTNQSVDESATIRLIPPSLVHITGSEIKRTRYFTLDVKADLRIAPFPQFYINGYVYNTTFVNEVIELGTSEEWIIFNPRQAVHPFHIHVFSFFVKDVQSSFQPENKYMEAQKDCIGSWRDTVNVPAKGYVKIWIRFDEHMPTSNSQSQSNPNNNYLSHLKGKSVFHCHFEGHADTGMTGNMLLK